MNGLTPIMDIQRVVRIEAESAQPNAPIRTEREGQERTSVISTTRMQTTQLLRWLADRLEPKAGSPVQLTTPEGPGC